MGTKKKASSRPFIIGAIAIGIVAAGALYFSSSGKTQNGISVATKEKTFEKKDPITYLGLDLSEDGLLKDQALELGKLTPPIPNFSSDADFASAQAEQDIHVQKEFLELVPNSTRGDVFFAKRYTPIIVDVYGDIGKIPLVRQSSNLEYIRFEAKAKTAPFVVSFSTRLNHKSGRIFWHRLTKSSGKENIDHLATEVLKSLQFAKGYEEEVSRGEITLVLNLERGVNLQKQLLERLRHLEEISFQAPKTL